MHVVHGSDVLFDMFEGCLGEVNLYGAVYHISWGTS